MRLGHCSIRRAAWTGRQCEFEALVGHFSTYSVVAVENVAEPASLVLFGSALLLIGGMRVLRRRGPACGESVASCP